MLTAIQISYMDLERQLKKFQLITDIMLGFIEKDKELEYIQRKSNNGYRIMHVHPRINEMPPKGVAAATWKLPVIPVM